jgi:predicted DNA binding CopG/RHH family protein
MSVKGKNKSLPKLKSDREAEVFLSSADLTEYDFSEFQPMNFEFEAKSARINMRVPENLLDRIKQAADDKKIPYTRYIRQLLEASLKKER